MSIEANKLLISALPEVSIVPLKMAKTTKVTKIVGTVVKDMYFMWVNKSVPAIAGAKFVVSESGDILSPK